MKDDAFSAFERQGWEQLAQTYHAYYADLTTQSSGALLDALEVGPGTRFLDVASGPGYIAAAAAARGADAVGVDFAAAMVEQATRLNPGLTFKVGSAQDLPFPDESFDAVGVNFGMFHFSHPEKALAEAFRVLHSGGRIAWQHTKPTESFVCRCLLCLPSRKSARCPLPCFRVLDASGRRSRHRA